MNEMIMCPYVRYYHKLIIISSSLTLYTSSSSPPLHLPLAAEMAAIHNPRLKPQVAAISAFKRDDSIAQNPCILIRGNISFLNLTQSAECFSSYL